MRVRLRSEAASSARQSTSPSCYACTWWVSMNQFLRLKQKVQQITQGANCIVITFSRKHRMLRKNEFPENRSVQLQSLVDIMQATKSQKNMIRDPRVLAPTSIMMSVFSVSIDSIAALWSAGVFFSSHFSFYPIQKPMQSSNRVTMRSSPLMTIQSMSLQLQPRLKEVLTSAVPSPSEMTNQSRKLATLRTLLRRLTFLSTSWLLIQQILQNTWRMLTLAQISRFLMVASMKNSSKTRQYSDKNRVCSSPNRQMLLSSFDSWLFCYRDITWYPRTNSISINVLTIPSKRRRKQTNAPSVQ